MKNIKTIIVFIALAIIAVGSAGSVFARQVTFHQPITARVCVLTEIVGDELSYDLTPGCGLLVPNMGVAWAEADAAYARLGSGANDQLARLFYRVDTSVFLDSRMSVQPEDGYMLYTKEGATYTFYLSGDGMRGAPRSFDIVAIEQDKVALQFWPGGKVVWLDFDERTELDIAYDDTTDLIFRVMNIRDDGTVLIHMSFPQQDGAQGLAEGRAAYVSAVLLFTVAIALLFEYTYGVYLVKHSLPSREWWVNHHHDPLE